MLENDQEITKLIRRLVPINELDKSVQNELIQEADLLELKPGGFLFRQGENDSYSYYQLDGEMDILSGEDLHNTIVGGTDRARHAMAQLQPRRFSAKARTACLVLRLNRQMLDKWLVMAKQSEKKIDLSDTISGPGQLEVNEIDEQETVDWMTKLLQSDLFVKMPTGNIQKLFSLLQSTPYQPGDVIVKQGETNDHYYIIQEGRCIVTRKANPRANDIKLAELGVGESFGEESLLMDTTCNATVSMSTAGTLMKLSKDNFIELIKNPTLTSFSLKEAQEQIAAGAKWMDVRFATEYEETHIEGSLNIPLNLLRLESQKLDHDKQYIVYCDTGGRSSAATFLLAERGFNANYLEGGLISNPDLASEVATVEKSEKTEPKIDTKTEEKVDPLVKATEIDTKLECTNIKLKDIEQMRQQVSEVQAKTKAKLEKDKQQLEQEKQEAIKQAKDLKHKQEERIKKLEQDKEEHLKGEKQKLEQIYQSDTLEMAKFHKLKSKYEEEVKQEKEKLAAKQAEAEKLLAEARRIKMEVEGSRKKLEQETVRRQHEQDELQKKLENELKRKLAEERQGLSEGIAKTTEEIQAVQREQDLAEAARKAAREEAEKIISEFKKNHVQAMQLEEQNLRKEREKLELQSIKIQDTIRKLDGKQQQKKTVKVSASEGQKGDDGVQSQLEQDVLDFIQESDNEEQSVEGSEKLDVVNAVKNENEQAEQEITQQLLDDISSQVGNTKL